jgi:tRNA U34 2-thiouridine synthase MnmA/TrmU
VDYLKSHAPKNFIKNGEIMNADGTIMYGEHQGIVNHPYGEVMTTEGAARRTELHLAQYNFKEHKIILKSDEAFLQERILLTECTFAEEVSWIEPMKAVIELTGRHFVDCWIYPKCLNSAYIVWEGKHKILAGEIASLYKKRGKNSKVLMTGKVRYLTPPVDEFSGDKDGLEKKVTIDRAKDF